MVSTKVPCSAGLTNRLSMLAPGLPVLASVLPLSDARMRALPVTCVPMPSIVLTLLHWMRRVTKLPSICAVMSDVPMPRRSMPSPQAPSWTKLPVIETLVLTVEASISTAAQPAGMPDDESGRARGVEIADVVAAHAHAARVVAVDGAAEGAGDDEVLDLGVV